MMWWHFSDGASVWSWTWTAVMMVLMIGFWGVFLWLLYSLVGGVKKRSGTDAGNPEEIARRRFASGEITQEEFDRIIVGLRR